jgi:hypothetical protein
VERLLNKRRRFVTRSVSDPTSRLHSAVTSSTIQQVPATITLQARERSKPLPAAVLSCPDVEEAIATKRIAASPASAGAPPETTPAADVPVAPLPAPKATRKAAPPAGGDT